MKEVKSTNSLYEIAENYSIKVNGDYFNDLFPNCDETIGQITINDFIAGYKKHQEITKDKQFTYEEVIKFTTWLRTTYYNIEGHSPKECFDEWLKSK